MLAKLIKHQELSQRARCVFLLLAFALSFPLQGYAEGKKAPFSDGPKTIASKEHVSVLIDREITDGKKFIVLKISVPTDSQVKAFTLADPPRVVVDFEGASIKKSEDFQAPENEVIKTVRLGAHPQKIRVVLDMRRSTPPEYEWKAGKRQAILRFFEGQAEGAQPSSTAVPAPSKTSPTTAPVPAVTSPKLPETTAPLPVATKAPTLPATPVVATAIAATPVPATAVVATAAVTTAPQATAVPATPVPATAAPATPQQKTLSDVEPKNAGSQSGSQPQAAAPEVGAKQGVSDLGDLEKGPAEPRAQTTFSVTGFKFEYLADKTPVLKIILNKPRAETQISKVDDEGYKIDIKDCGIENEDLELPQFPPHDFVGFVMVLAEVVGKNLEISVNTEENVVLGTSVHENEIWVKKP